MAAKDMKTYQRPGRHEKRWTQLIKPLVDPDGKDRLFLDLGCNAGFYMVKAEKLGYRTIGVEKDPGFVAQAPDHLNIIQRDIIHYQPPANFLTLMACVHYHQQVPAIESIFRQLSHASAYLLVQGRHQGRVTSPPDKESLLRWLRGGWDVIDGRTTDKFYTILAKNKRVVEWDVKELYENSVKRTKEVGGHSDFFEPFADFVRRVMRGEKESYETTPFWRYLRTRKVRYRHGLCFWYQHLVEEAMENGITSILTHKGNAVTDGHHRLVIAKELGITRIISKQRRSVGA